MYLDLEFLGLPGKGSKSFFLKNSCDQVWFETGGMQLKIDLFHQLGSHIHFAPRA